ncbi:MetQ/NlpA family ABC transporter substrate-binding protein [Cupriavidus basilensis]
MSIAIATLGIVASGAALAQEQTLRVGTVSGPDARGLASGQKVAKREGLNIKVVEFNDYVQPNAALDAGDLDANSFQHQPYLDEQIKQRGYKMVSVGYTYISPLGIYSQKLKSPKDLPQGARVAVPNDPSNENRAAAAGRARRDQAQERRGHQWRQRDAAGRQRQPEKLKIVELDAAQLARALPDVAAAVINTNYALAAGLQPTRNAIALEDIHQPVREHYRGAHPGQGQAVGERS